MFGNVGFGIEFMSYEYDDATLAAVVYEYVDRFRASPPKFAQKDSSLFKLI